ncbi:MAG: nuclear transport factor 2 family protein [Candidatus Dadabacteria bacterium]|nr:nuclear transport factor 2 family protein [Candidatus Dadabacteria bacterium]NIS09975.1 nuclear transport factor 2 family protein [Candidatus Dadabacteria bacterium]NIY22950.1 DUF4440 domain-containing protein [Candidatus Dadabacteria bacterium]
MSDKKQEILKLNTRFYEALGSNDIELMESVWVQDHRAKCIHPGWPLLIGWDPIKKSWENIFVAGGISGVNISDVHIEITDEVCWVTCIEHVSHVIDDKIAVNLIQATNVFEDTGNDKWSIVLHHASSIPITRGFSKKQTLQ